MRREFDLLIIGAGPAGMAAAMAASSSGKRIALLDDNPATGGQIWRAGAKAPVYPAAEKLRAELDAANNIELFTGTRVIAQTASHELLLENALHSWRIGYGQLIFCTGAREVLLPFPGWTLPGVTGAGGLQALIKGGMPLRHQRVVIAGSGPLLLASAASAKSAGAQVLHIAEQASSAALAAFAMHLPRWPSKLLQAVQLFDRRYHGNSQVVEALGDGRLEAVRIRQGNRLREIPCERLACGFGLRANTELAQTLGCSIGQQAIEVDDLQRTTLPDHFAAGECTGIGGNELAQVEGAIAGFAAIGEQAKAQALFAKRQHWQAFADLLKKHFSLNPTLKQLPAADTLLCRCEDVPYGAVAGHADWRQAKLSSRCGMGACQGRVCATAAEFLLGWPTPSLRAPFVPARVASLLPAAALPSAAQPAVE
ncbi:MAG: FAD/NAD(P)-binding oxidoreductase [Pseudomonas sp.]|uniref:FAD/NAD(P)-binding oxidoreductase n=1 Tax=Pseudomonas sp. TaxID=306 RepID=UPI0030F292EC